MDFIRLLSAASDYAKCGSLDQALEVSVEGVRSCSHGKRVFATAQAAETAVVPLRH